MVSQTFFAASAAVFFSTVAVAVDTTRDPGLIAQLDDAATQLDRLNLLSQNEDWLYDFTKQDYYTFSPGGVINMNAATFPAAQNNGMTLAMLNLGPCSMLPPHYHPRASNYVVAVLGNTTTYMYEENGAHTIVETLAPGQATIFPAASLHMMVNNGCENSQLVSALNSPDAGTNNYGQIFLNSFPEDLVNAAWGSNIVNENSRAKVQPVGTGASWGTDECLKRCNIVRPSGGSRR